MPLSGIWADFDRIDNGLIKKLILLETLREICYNDINLE